MNEAVITLVTVVIILLTPGVVLTLAAQCLYKVIADFSAAAANSFKAGKVLKFVDVYMTAVIQATGVIATSAAMAMLWLCLAYWWVSYSIDYSSILTL